MPPDRQAAFLASACDGNVALHEMVTALLAAGQAPASLLDATALEAEARHSARAAHPPAQGDLFGPYRIVRRIAAGGMSVVYEAERADAEFFKRVAIKLIQHGIDNAAAAERFWIERQILAQLEHPSIVRLLDGGTHDGLPYLVMEYVEGVSIDEFARSHQLSRAERLRLFLHVCDAVQYAHRNLVVHRDLKPNNILVMADGMPKLVDFGIAKLLSADPRAAAATIHALTPEYASPEQVAGRAAGTSTDVYSLGVLLFVLLADRLPYRAGADQLDGLVRAICDEEPVWDPRGRIDGDLRSVLARTLRKEPERRYLSVEQLAADVRRYLDGRPVTARSDGLLYRARKFVRRRALPLAAAAAVLVAIAGGAWSTLAQWRRAERRFDELHGLAHAFLYEVYDSTDGVPGALGTRRLIVGLVQEYLDRLSREVGDDSALTRDLAQAYIRLGDVRGRPYTANLGDTAGALESYQKAEALLEREAGRHPLDPAVEVPLCTVYLTSGRTLERLGDIDAALEIFSRAIRGAESLLARDPARVSYREQLSLAYRYKGEALSGRAVSGPVAASEEVLATYRRSLEIHVAGGSHPDESWQRSLSNIYFSIGNALQALGAKTGDVAYFRQALDQMVQGRAIRQRLAAAHPEHEYRRDLADSAANVGWMRWKANGDFDGAMVEFGRALTSFEAIAAADPLNLEAQRDVADAYLNIGRTCAAAGRRTDARAALGKALAIYEETVRTDPGNRENADGIAATRAVLGGLSGDQVRSGSRARVQ